MLLILPMLPKLSIPDVFEELMDVATGAIGFGVDIGDTTGGEIGAETGAAGTDDD